MLIDYVVYFYFLFWFLINFVDHVTKKNQIKSISTRTFAKLLCQKNSTRFSMIIPNHNLVYEVIGKLVNLIYMSADCQFTENKWDRIFPFIIKTPCQYM